MLYQLNGALPSDFDYCFLMKGIEMVILYENHAVKSKGLWFIYNTIEYYHSSEQQRLIKLLLSNKVFFNGFFHWSCNVKLCVHYLYAFTIPAILHSLPQQDQVKILNLLYKQRISEIEILKAGFLKFFRKNTTGKPLKRNANRIVALDSKYIGTDIEAAYKQYIILYKSISEETHPGILESIEEFEKIKKLATQKVIESKQLPHLKLRNLQDCVEEDISDFSEW
jgi:hypothetical protein